jgi:membrane protein DedA with SNARE-associated domain
MTLINELFHALWHQDFQFLVEQKLIWAIYVILFVVIFLENGLLPASFLPGDSLLLLAGTLIANHTMHFALTLLVLTVAAALGCWLSFVQGRWLGNTGVVQHWLEQLPEQYHQRAENLFIKHGLAALLIARFLAFVRTLLPTIAGLSGLDSKKFQIFNWLSGAIWVSCIVTLGYFLALTPIFKHYEKQAMELLMILPVALLVIGLSGAIIVVVKKRLAKSNGK